jgi:hypothetical protein
MTLRWPREREAATRPSFTDPSHRSEQDFRQLADSLDNSHDAFDRTVNWIVQQGGDISEFEERLAKACEKVPFQTISDNKDMLLPWTCAVALAKKPSVQTWKNVRNLSNDSVSLANWLAPAMIVRAERDFGARTAYIKLAKEVFSALDSFTLASPSDHTNGERANAWAYWTEERHEKLDEIWWGLRHWNPMNYEEEFPLLHLLNELAPNELGEVVAQSRNPYLAYSALLAADASGFTSRFSRWEALAANAPIAFRADGTWNGSILAPLLLMDAGTQLFHAVRDIPRFGISESEIEEATQETPSVIDAVVSSLATRHDALPLFARWSTWLMRHLLSYQDKDVNDIRSPAFIYNALIEAIGRKLSGQSVIQFSPPDAPAWEAWCYRCVLASHANNGFIDRPDSRNFLAEWTITPDDWSARPGQLLRERASFIITMSKEVPGAAAQLLAYPIVQSASPADAWIEMWRASSTLREIVEFGDADAGDEDYQYRSEAGKLLFFVFRIGLAILDQRASQITSSDSVEARSQASLFGALAAAVREMREIDNTLNRDEWIAAIQHLAIRRLIWEGPNRQTPGHLSIFCREDLPTFANFLMAAKSDAMGLVAILQSAMLNNPDMTRLQTELRTASVNLSHVTEMIRRLNQYSPRRYPINEIQLQQLAALSEASDTASSG